MRIFYSVGSDPMILDSVAGLNQLGDRLESFLESGRRSIRISADVTGSAQPYVEFLPGLDVEKASGPIDVFRTAERTLKVTGSPENLAVYASHFRFRDDEDGSHHHPEQLERPGYMRSGALAVIIEANTARIAGFPGES